jgi:hypothetical protein
MTVVSMGGPTVRFAELLAEAPAIAGPMAERFRSAGLGILGTLRSDGSPRVSPVELMFVGDGLFIGMMPGSYKHADARRDPRVSLLTAVSDRHDLGGEGKLFGRLRELGPDEADEVLRVGAAAAGLDADALAGSPVFEVLVETAAWQRVEGESWASATWSPTAGTRRYERLGPSGERRLV